MANEELIKLIRQAEEEVRRLCETDENKRRQALWEADSVANDYFHAVPKYKDRKPLVVEFEREAYAQALGFDIIWFYHDPLLHYLSSLRTNIFKFENFNDDTPISKRVPVYESTAYEKCIFKAGEVIYTEHDAVATKDILIEKRSDLDKMEYPDFYTSGCMPQTIEFYEKMREAADDDFEIAFPQWCRSPWGLAWQLRGTENLMFDYIEDPEWLRRLLDFLAEAQNRWTKQKCEYLGTKIAPCSFSNDECMTPIVSPQMYKDCIMPSEVKVDEFCGGIEYWHSCGETTDLFPLINELPDLHMVTVSAWSDVEKAGQEYNKDIALEVQLHNYRDVLHPKTPDTLADRLKLIKDSTKDHKSIVNACGIVATDGPEYTMDRVRVLADMAREILG